MKEKWNIILDRIVILSKFTFGASIVLAIVYLIENYPY